MEDGTRARKDPTRLFDRVVNCGHLWCLCGLRVSCCQVVTLARFKLARVSGRLSDMSDTCPL
jgi:hypothetical protein